MTSRTVQVPNISCGHCVKTIERELAGVAGVQSVSADAATHQVRVAWDESRASWEDVRRKLQEIHYPPSE
jgi:copper chaperone CopZ